MHPSNKALSFLTLLAALAPGAAATEDFFESQIRPILVEHCFDCHSGAKTKGGLALDSKNGWQKGGDSGPAVLPGDP